MSEIKVLIVDDSAFMRIALRKMLEAEGGFKIVGEAQDGAQGVRMAAMLRPDAITMDVEMPKLDGISAVKKIMAEAPAPILMVSSLTQAGSHAALRGMDSGAVDFVSKSSEELQMDIAQVNRKVIEKLKYWGKRKVSRRGIPVEPKPSKETDGAATGDQRLGFETSKFELREAGWRNQPLREFDGPPSNIDLIMLGASTGGPRTVNDFLFELGSMPVPVVVAIHMPASFTDSYANHCHDLTGLPVREGKNLQLLVSNDVVVAPGGHHTRFRRSPTGMFQICVDKAERAHFSPSIDKLFESGADIAKNPMGIIFTGMGDDGTKGARALAKGGHPVVVQRPDTCVVDGMPMSALLSGVVSHVYDIKSLAATMRRWFAPASA